MHHHVGATSYHQHTGVLQIASFFCKFRAYAVALVRPRADQSFAVSPGFCWHGGTSRDAVPHRGHGLLPEQALCLLQLPRAQSHIHICWLTTGALRVWTVPMNKTLSSLHY